MLFPLKESRDAQLCRWQEEGAINAESLKTAKAVAEAVPNSDRQSAAAWFSRLAWLCLTVGALSFSAGVIFFFAYNWADLPRLAKIGLLQCAMLIVLSVLAWFDRRSLHIPAAAALLMLDLLFGALLAVVGQVYQTGADPWQLFALWSLFSLLLAIGYGCGWLWCCFIVQLNLALFLYFQGEGQWPINHDQTLEYALIASVNLMLHLLLSFSRFQGSKPQSANSQSANPKSAITQSAITQSVASKVLRAEAANPIELSNSEANQQKSKPVTHSLSNELAQNLALILGLANVLMLCAWLLFSKDALWNLDGSIIVILGGLLLAPVIYLYYRLLAPSALGLGLWGFTAIAALTMVLLDWVFNIDTDPVGAFLLIGLFVTASSSVLVLYLKSMLKDMAAHEGKMAAQRDNTMESQL